MIINNIHRPSKLCQDPDSITRTFLEQFVLVREGLSRFILPVTDTVKKSSENWAYFCINATMLTLEVEFQLLSKIKFYKVHKIYQIHSNSHYWEGMNSETKCQIWRIGVIIIGIIITSTNQLLQLDSSTYSVL